MLILVGLYIQLALAAKYAEYKFGVSYGSTYIDYSGRNFHASNGGSSSTSRLTHSDRGVYIGGGDKHVLLPEQYTSTKLSSTFSILLWAMPKTQTGRVFFRGKGTSNNFMILGETANQRLNFQFNSGGVAYDNYLPSLSFETGKWVLILLVKINTNFKLYTNKYESASATYTYAEESSILYDTFIGSYASNRPAFSGFVWYFLINDQTAISPSDYYSDGTYQTCTYGPCVSCTTAFKDPDSGNICLATVTDQTKNSNSATCSSSNGCSIYTAYTCSCTASCTYSITTGVCGCVSTTGVSSSTSCSCSGTYTLRSQKCCNPKCATCSTSETCLTCIDPNGSVSSGACVCKSGFYGTPNSASTTSCSSCKSGCSSCTTGTDCAACFDPNAQVTSDSCTCKSGYYGIPSTTTTSSCYSCPTKCTTCTSSSNCLACIDPNAEISSGACVCKSGYSGTPSSTSTTSCYICKTGCSDCASDNGCTVCNDPNAEAISNNCVCKSGYSGTPSLDSSGGCFTCLSKCSTCTSGTDCTGCTDPNAEVSGDTCVCKAGYYGTASSTTTTTCNECNSGCTSCTSSSDCSGCLDPNAEMSGTSCVCQAGYLGTASRTTSTGCFVCNSKCSNCVSTGGCTECYDPNGMVSSNQCVCKTGYYGTTSSDSTTSCSSCPDTCSACTSNSDCTACIDPNSQVSSGSCQCKSGFYGSPSTTTTSTCNSCGLGCSSCSDASNCLSCYDTNAELSGGGCTCKSGFYGSPGTTADDDGCSSCPVGCEICTTSSSCDQCADANSEFISSACFCQAGYYGTISSILSTCTICNDICSECISSSVCTQCKDPEASPVSGVCKCNNGYYGTPSAGPATSCLECLSECKTCDDGSTCLTCNDPNSQVDSGICKCKAGFSGTPSSTSVTACYECPDGCSICVLSDCFACMDPYAEVVSNECVCISGYYGTPSLTSTTNCEKCASECETCSSSSKCITCADSSMILLSGSCSCQDGFYFDGTKCKSCEGECSTCTSATVCKTCLAYNATPNLKGYCECNAGFYNISDLSSENTCLECLPDCSSCSNNTSCLTCIATSSELNSNDRCVCQEGYWNDSLLITENSCKGCYFRCGSCFEENQCLACIGKYTELQSGSCVCKSGYYYESDESVDCIMCPGYKIEGKCKAICGQNEIFIDDFCVSCPDMCSACLKNLTCTSCSDKAELNDGLCVCSPGYKSIDLTCVESYFTFTLVDIGFYSIELTFSEHPAQVITKSDFNITSNENQLNFTLTNKDNLTYIVTPKMNAGQSVPSSLNFTITKYPLYSKESSQLNMYSINFAYSVQSNSFSAIESMSQAAVSTSVSSTAIVSNPAASWVLVNTIHMIVYMPLNSLPYSKRIKDFARSIGSFNLIPNFIEMIFSGNSTSLPYFEARDFGFSTSLFWINFGKNFIIFLFFVVCIPIIFGFSKIKKIENVCARMMSNYKYTFFLRFWIQIYLEIGIFALIQMTSTIRIEDQGYFNYVSAAISIVFVILTPFVLFFIIWKYHPIFTAPEIIKKYGSFFAEFKNDQGMAGYMFYPIYFARRLSYILIQILLIKYPGLQISLNIGFSLIQLSYILYYRPFKEPLIMFSEFAGEVCVINSFIASIFFLDDKNLFPVEQIENVIIYSVVSAMIAQMTICIYFTGKSLMKIWKRFRNHNRLSFSTKVGKEPDSALIAGRSSTMINKMIDDV